jgi:riboflavin synthase
MYTGIVQARGRVLRLEAAPHGGRLWVQFPPALMRGLQLGASVAVDGVCLSVVAMSGREIAFDVVQATLAQTNLADRRPGDELNLERSARQGAEIGGHPLSGHVSTTGIVASAVFEGPDAHLAFTVAPRWARYLFERGFVAVDGASLTVSVADPARGECRVQLIPDTLRRTALRRHRPGSRVNVEVEHHTQVLVDVVERVLARGAAQPGIQGSYSEGCVLST